MTHLYFCRHGESWVNINDIFATKAGTANDLGLTDLGKAHAKAAGEQAIKQSLKPDIIICSPLRRTVETADIIAEMLGHKADRIILSDLFLELQFGALEGTAWHEWWDKGKTYADLGEVAGAETIEQLQARAQSALDYLQNLSQDNVLVVGHSAFGRALQRTIAKIPYTDEFINHTSLPHGQILQLL